MVDTVLAQLVALKVAPVGDLKLKWRELFEGEPPPYNRRFLESRLAYRIQELAYGGLSPETRERLDTLADELEGKGSKRRSRPYMYGLAFTFGAYVLYDLARFLQWNVEGTLLSGLFLIATASALVSVWGLYKDRPR